MVFYGLKQTIYQPSYPERQVESLLVAPESSSLSRKNCECPTVRLDKWTDRPPFETGGFFCCWAWTSVVFAGVVS